jgi:prepilin-type N-terminal cleavage/methylation domain-containing protein
MGRVWLHPGRQVFPSETALVGILEEEMKMKSGFTLVEVMIFIAIVGIVVITVFRVGAALTPGSGVSIGLNGLTEVRCIEGYRFVISGEGNARQILDEFGKGARCQ